MEFIDYYKILELDKTATQAEIKKAYRKLARKLHPDLNPNDKSAQEKFQRVNEANEVLSDPEKRKKYDQYGKDWEHAEAFEEAKKSQRSSNSNTNRTYTNYSGQQEDFSDFFESMFGGGGFGGSTRQRTSQFKGQDLNATLNLNMTDILHEQKQTLDLGNKKIRITIPAGVEDGQTIKITGYGGEGVNGGPKGDLYLTFEIYNNTDFQRVGNDLYKNESISLYDAILGSSIEITTLTGKVKLKVKPETQNDTKIKLKGKGMPIYKKKGAHGDLYITYKVTMPTNLSQKEKELFKQLSELR
ncbi:curved DNA-binding protein [Maribacter dokdonensis]|uniref:DnaJ C-terminal domain-containing protein n=1 Tax=Maribacter dokdonensis TaxID=320912 RepID=UPI001B23A60D|nr:J domain-containing protein [Maribacter dokdonensis]CAG2532307.1 curved DNA-binding protein [Maribacter dokdonensis]|tara:strand:+ start:469 stop:1368 length:900 start_codon:yes stop_codon:yes gene_type:complete